MVTCLQTDRLVEMEPVTSWVFKGRLVVRVSVTAGVGTQTDLGATKVQWLSVTASWTAGSAARQHDFSLVA